MTAVTDNRLFRYYADLLSDPFLMLCCAVLQFVMNMMKMQIDNRCFLRGFYAVSYFKIYNCSAAESE